MNRTPTALLIIVVACLALSGCQTTDPQIVTKVVERKIEIPPSLLKCLPEPVAAAAWEMSAEAALFLNQVADAGQDCRSKLAAVKRLLAAQ